MIRPATLRDLPDIVALGQEFHDMAGAHVPFDPSTCESFLRGMIKSRDQAAIFVIEHEGDVVGTAGVMTHPLFFNMNETAAAETFWFVSSNYRGHGYSRELFDALERWAREHGAVTMTMAAVATNPTIGAMYERRGYTLHELNYTKKL